MTRAVLRWLGRHPLVWLVPVLFFLALCVFALVQLGGAPQTEFVYDV